MAEKKIIEGVYVPVAGPDENYLDFLETDELCSATHIVGGEIVSSSVVDALRFAEADVDSIWPEFLHAYQTESGRTYPRLYRTRIVVETEEVPETEATRIWDDWKARMLREHLRDLDASVSSDG